jgi:two-component system sensor histidine kinase KdpD
MPVRSRHFAQSLLYPILALALVAVVTYLNFAVLKVNNATAGFSYLLVVLALATRAGIEASVPASVASMLCYNYYFLPPVGTLNIADPQNLVALFAFLVTAVTASHLSSRAHKEAREADTGRREMARLYEFSRALMLGDSERKLAGQIAQRIAQVFAVPSVVFYVLSEDILYQAGPAEPLWTNESSSEIGTILRLVAKGGGPWSKPNVTARVIPVGLGGRTLGSLGLAGAELSDAVLSAIAQLAAIALERVRVQDAVNRTESARENEKLKSTLLDALAHEFKTPLTSIKAAVSTVLAVRTHDAMESELLTIVEEEADRLTDLVTESIKIARIGAGHVQLRRQVISVSDLISSALAKLRNVIDGRPVAVHLAETIPSVSVDPELIQLVLRQLVLNALKYSPSSGEISVSAEPQGAFVAVHVKDTGPGIPEAEQAAVFEKFYRGQAHRNRISGTGMGLTIAREIVHAHGGEIWLQSRTGDGAQFSFTLPLRDPAKSEDE